MLPPERCLVCPARCLVCPVPAHPLPSRGQAGGLPGLTRWSAPARRLPLPGLPGALRHPGVGAGMTRSR